jgi:UV excision repair protein RAD23
MAPPAVSANSTPTGPMGTPAPTPNVPAPGQSLNLFEAAAAQARSGGAAAGITPGAAAATDPAAIEQLGMLRNSAQFQQLRQLIQAQPELLQPVLQQLAQSSPEMMQASFFLF